MSPGAISISNTFWSRCSREKNLGLYFQVQPTLCHTAFEIPVRQHCNWSQARAIIIWHIVHVTFKIHTRTYISKITKQCEQLWLIVWGSRFKICVSSFQFTVSSLSTKQELGFHFLTYCHILQHKLHLRFTYMHVHFAQ